MQILQQLLEDNPLAIVLLAVASAPLSTGVFNWFVNRFMQRAEIRKTEADTFQIMQESVKEANEQIKESNRTMRRQNRIIAYTQRQLDAWARWYDNLHKALNGDSHKLPPLPEIVTDPMPEHLRETIIQDEKE